MDKPSKDTLYYDGSCPLCRREIDKLSQYSKSVETVDIHTLENFSNLPDKNALLQQLHLKTAQGEWLIGVDANIAAWKQTPFYWLWRLLKLPLVHPVADKAYGFWARWRFKRRYK